MAVDRDTLVREYFDRGYDYEEIITTLREVHSKIISLRQLHRVLRNQNLYRRKYGCDTRDVISFVRSQLRSSGSSLGYRLMHQRCLQAGYRTSRENIRIILKLLDPIGVEERSKKVLRRRQYWSYGPNWVWHIDGYDKLKPYGFPIHGAIDGFSRRIMWLEVTSSNKDPEIICSFYLKCIKKISGTPRKIVADRGTENVHVAASQRFLRRNDQDNNSGEASFKYGKSVTNQRIESWWAMLRRTCTNWWINYFRDLIENDLFDTSNNVHCEVLNSVFIQF